MSEVVSVSRFALLISLVALVAPTALVANTARAQSDDPYQRGVEALESGALDVALMHFREAFANEASVSHALALAATLQESELLTEAVTLYERLLSDALGTLSVEQRTHVEHARQVADGARAVLTIRFDGAGTLDVELDGRTVGTVDADEPLTLRVDPGAHRLLGRTGSRASEEYSVVLRASGGETVDLVVPTGADDLVVDDADGGEHRDPTSDQVIESTGRWDPAPWIVLGLAAVPLGVGIATGVVFDDRASAAREAGSHRDAQPYLDEARPFGIAANVSFVVAGVVALTGLAWGLLSLATSESTTVAVGPGGILVRGSF